MNQNPYKPPNYDIENHQNTQYPTKKLLWVFNITSLLLLFLNLSYLGANKSAYIFDIKIIIEIVVTSIIILIIPNLMISFWLFYKKYHKGFINFLKIIIGYFLLWVIYAFIAVYLLEVFIYKSGVPFFEWLISFLKYFILLISINSFIVSVAIILVLPNSNQKENL